ncbi:MAG TPA: tRNA 2-thiouridine(34) synthase MnmA [Solirubrobacteraceae bacterium]|jgi:tRNA-specific 2-thiouridylase|nr:tRNA 2-thiouridine(34) synthase MnmA [Solirubrobacteraceae bacterium]
MEPSAESLRQHLEHPLARGHRPLDACSGAAGGAACGDLIRISLTLDADSDDGRIADAGFDASGCGATIAAGSAVVSLLRGSSLLDAARIGAAQIAEELGGLIAAKRHAAELAADALHRALGWAARDRAQLAACALRTLVAMSGGVDSAVAALLLAREGAETVAVTLELWSDAENDGETSCCSAQAVRGARDLAHGLGMAHLSIDLREEFRAGVVDGWLADHGAGLTPNPCVRCNGNVRLDAMLALGERLGARTLATGHYARVLGGDDADRDDADRGDAVGERGRSGTRPLLRMAVDRAKDQSYVLSALAPDSLARLRFPLGELHKQQVRELAAEAGLGVARKPDSQDLCFLAGTRHGDFLARHGGLGERRGPIVDRAATVLGEHRGAHSYTVGQRHGLGIGAPMPLYVLATDTETNTVTVGPREALLSTRLALRELTLHRDGRYVDGVRVRSHGRCFACRVEREPAAGRHAHASIALAEPAERTAPGQIACLYAGDVVVGYATIEAQSLRHEPAGELGAEPLLASALSPSRQTRAATAPAERAAAT